MTVGSPEEFGANCGGKSLSVTMNDIDAEWGTTDEKSRAFGHNGGFAVDAEHVGFGARV